MIKKYFTTITMAIMMAVAIPALAGTALAQKKDFGRNDRSRTENRRADRNRNYDRNQNERYDNQNDGYYDENYGYDQPNVYDRHRKAINIGVATGAGAVIGAIFGGKKGALIGAAAGAVGGAVVTKVQKPRNTNRYPYQY